MANFGDLIGAFMQNAMAPSGQQRMGNALEDLVRSGMASLGGVQDASPGAPGGAAQGGGIGDLIGQVLGAAQSGLGSAARNPGQAGGLGAIVGGLLGGGSGSVKGALGGGALAMLASIAFKALQGAGQGATQGSSGGTAGTPGFNLPGLMAPETPAQQQAVETAARVVLKGMISAAKADGQIDPSEMQRIVGKLQEVGMDEQTKAWVLNEMGQPLDLDALAAEIPSQEIAAQVYAASMLAIEVDTDAERRYLAQLAQKTGLHPMVAQHILQSMGMTA